MWHLVVAIAFFIFIIVVAYFAEIPKDTLPDDILGGNTTIEAVTLTIKVALIVAWIQVIRFISKNYFALKHLCQMAQHKSSILRCLHAIYENTDDEKKKETLLMAGAVEVFRVYETGYLSKKEGAGSISSNNQGDFLSKAMGKD